MALLCGVEQSCADVAVVKVNFVRDAFEADADVGESCFHLGLQLREG